VSSGVAVEEDAAAAAALRNRSTLETTAVGLQKTNIREGAYMASVSNGIANGHGSGCREPQLGCQPLAQTRWRARDLPGAATAATAATDHGQRTHTVYFGY
jgi:hypothetical protein